MKAVLRLTALTLVLLSGVAPPAAGKAPAAGPTIEAKPAGRWTAGAMIAAANPLAVDAGLDVLRKGGSAVDAAIAVQAVLGLVEPQSSGLGGGAFLIYYDAKSGDVQAYDGRETAPAGATPALFLGADGKPIGFLAAVRSGKSVGVPGVVALLDLAHKDHGALSFGDDVAAAIKLARDGFAVSKRLNLVISEIEPYGPLPPDVAAYLTSDGKTPLAVGSILKNPAYAQSLERIAKEGAAGFYQGPLAEAIVAADHKGDDGGTLALSDLSGFKARRLEPLCRPYRDDLVCSMPSPSSGGLGILSALGILSHFDMAAADAKTALGWHLFIEAQRLAYADRDMYAGDDRFVQVPVAGLLDPDYLKSRAALIQADKALPSVEAGMPAGAPKRAGDFGGSWTGTSHFVIVDKDGNVVSMTTTVEGPFGSGRMAGGFFLNNQLTDFSFAPTDDKGVPVANAVAPGKKPRSSMAPTIVFHDGRFKLATGSPGGNAIIAYVLKALVASLDWHMSPQDAAALPNVVARTSVIVEPSFDKAIRAQLTAMGYAITDSQVGEVSGFHSVMLDETGHLVGGADPRREGAAKTP